MDTDQPFRVGDLVRVARIPPHIDAPDYPYEEVKCAFAAALGKTFRVEEVDWGGWVWLLMPGGAEGIGVQPDCVELVQRPGPSPEPAAASISPRP